MRTETLTMADFRARVLAALAAALPEVRVEEGAEPDTLLVYAQGLDEDLVLALGNLYAQAIGAAGLDAVLGQIVDMTREMGSADYALQQADSWGDSVARLMLQIGWPTPADKSFVERPWHLGLVAIAVLNYETHLTYVTEAQRARWGVPAEQVFTAGLAGLRRYARTVRPDWYDLAGGRAAVVRDDSAYAASLVLAPEVIRAWFPGGEPVVISIPHRDCLLAVPYDLPVGDVAMAVLIAHHLAPAYPVLMPRPDTGFLLLLEDDRIGPLRADGRR